MAWFVDWDAETGTMQPGSIKRASSSNDKVWGEMNAGDTVLPYGTFVAVSAEGGVKKISATTDIVHGIIVRDIYAGGAPADKTVNVGHFSHGDCVCALAVEGQSFSRGDKVYIVATGEDAGKVTAEKAGNLDLGYWVEEVSAGNNAVAITLGYTQTVGE